MLIMKEAFEEKQLENVKKLYEAAFPPSEKKPFADILAKRAEGCVEVLAIEDDKKRFRGLIITMLYQDMVLIDYFAIEEENRGSGIGSDILKLFFNRYKDKRVFLEIESTVSEQSKDYEVRLRRKAFYEKNGLNAQDYLIELYGIEMEIMAFECKISFEEYHELLVHVYGKELGKNVQFIRFL